MNIRTLMKQMISCHGEMMQTIVAMEEMAELTKELSKHLRGVNNHDAIIEEVADVYIMLEQIKLMHSIGNSELHGMIAKKMLRMEAGLKGVNKNESV